jgi:4-hydroxybenzoate polyprenyltransferase
VISVVQKSKRVKLTLREGEIVDRKEEERKRERERERENKKENSVSYLSFIPVVLALPMAWLCEPMSLLVLLFFFLLLLLLHRRLNSGPCFCWAVLYHLSHTPPPVLLLLSLFFR